MKKQLLIEQDNAIAAHKVADGPTKKVLEALFPKAFNRNLLETLKTFKDVCDEMGVDEDDYEIRDVWTNEEKADMYRKRLKLIAKLLNGDWKANIGDTSQYKYYPYFKVITDSEATGGFRLSFLGVSYYCSVAVVGARPFFKTSAIAAFAGKTFTAEYEGATQYESLFANE